MSSHGVAESDPFEAPTVWAGELLSVDYFAFRYPVDATPTSSSHAERFALALTNEHAVLVRESDLGRFLVAHADRKLVCFEADKLHRDLLKTLRERNE